MTVVDYDRVGGNEPIGLFFTSLYTLRCIQILHPQKVYIMQNRAYNAMRTRHKQHI